MTLDPAGVMTAGVDFEAVKAEPPIFSVSDGMVSGAPISNVGLYSRMAAPKSSICVP